MFWAQPPLGLAGLEAQCHAKWNVTRLADASSPLDRSAVHNLGAFSQMIFSNNLLDPASSGGIKATPRPRTISPDLTSHYVDPDLARPSLHFT